MASATNGYILALKNDNSLWVCGDNNHAQLGNMESEVKDVLTPIKILDDVKKICINYGDDVVGAIRNDNSLNLWGSGAFYTQEYGWIDNAGSPYKSMDSVKLAVVHDAPVSWAIEEDLYRSGYG